MILPIYAYGHQILRTRCAPIAEVDTRIAALISDMWETLYHTNGVGLAAPQVGQALRLFVVDTVQIKDEEKMRTDKPPIKKVFINAQIIAETGNVWRYEEGCLSIPQLRGDVSRNTTIRIRYLDEHGQAHEEEFDGINARVIQHEYDHIEGVLFIDKISPLKKQLLQRKLEAIRGGRVDADYVMKFAPIGRR